MDRPEDTKPRADDDHVGSELVEASCIQKLRLILCVVMVLWVHVSWRAART